MRISFLATGAKSGSTPPMNDCANNRGVAAPKFGCSRTWRGPKRGGYAAGSATNCQLGQMKIQGRTLEEASNSRVLLDDLITKIIITISRPSPVQWGLPWYLKWILALPPYLSYVHTYLTIYSLHNLCCSLKKTLLLYNYMEHL